MFMPFCIFAFCMPVGTLELLKNITMPLQLMASSISGWIAHAVLGFNVSCQGTKIIDNASGVVKYEIARGCSGIRSLISLFALMTIYGMVTYRSPWRRLALVVTSVPLAIICNIIRLICVIIAGEVFGHKASEFVHEWSGFFTYALAIGCMVMLSRWWTEAPVESKEAPAHE
jgi:exosortase